jgi:hypothetical protein
MAIFVKNNPHRTDKKLKNLNFNKKINALKNKQIQEWNKYVDLNKMT